MNVHLRTCKVCRKVHKTEYKRSTKCKDCYLKIGRKKNKINKSSDDYKQGYKAGLKEAKND